MQVRVYKIRNHGSVLFLEYLFKNQLIQAKLAFNQTKDYLKLKKQLHVGALIDILASKKELNSSGRLVELILDLKMVLKPEESKFPKNFPTSPILHKELRYKNFILTLISDLKLKKKIETRAQILRLVRLYFSKKNALEIDLPVLEQAYGGANAQPFYTYANYNKKKYYLRVSFEFPLKKLIIGNFTDVFAIGPCFRNEDMDRTHTFEYTHLQYYTTSRSYEEVLKMVEDLFKLVYKKVNSKREAYHGFNLSNPWPRYNKIDIAKLIQEKNVSNLEELQKKHFLGPCYHLQNLEENPLGKGPYIFETYVNYDMELTTAYQEENSPTQLEKKLNKLGPPLKDSEIDFIKHLQFGLPETVGLGIGIDRFVQAILEESSIRDCQIYPKF